MKVKYFLGCLFTTLIMLFIIPLGVNAEENAIDVATVDEFIAATENKNINIINVTEDITFADDANEFDYVLDVSGFTIDLNGHTIYSKHMTLLFQGINFIIKNGAFDSTNISNYPLFIGDMGDTDNVIIENISVNGGINVFNSFNVILKNVDSTALKYYAVWCDENAHVTIESGNFKTTDNSTALLGMSGTETNLDVKGGTFTANGKKLVLDDGNNTFNKPIISGGTFDVPYEEIEQYLAEGYELKIDKNGNYSVISTPEEEIVEIPTTNKVTTTKYTVTYNPNPVKIIPTTMISTTDDIESDETLYIQEDKKQTIEKTDNKNIKSVNDEKIANLSWWWVLIVLFGIAFILTYIILLIKKRKK